ncbi:CHAT domain-containing protein [Streptomyces sp. ms184]|uniref:CHAT domain-containing protein n=1 Tax=Streptomyces sp. ms184 TaxID=1827974 RepID=UPI0015CF5B3E|nr:CHAT domain-containing protein [Streptomyces sp. ms184]
MDNGETGITDVLGAKPAAGNARRSARDPAAPLADKDATGPDRTPWLKVSVLWGNLTEVPADVHMTGHYAGVAPTSAEKALDEAISGGDRHIVAERNRRGWIDARLGRITYFPTPSPPPRPAPDGAEGCAIHAAAVIGMGRMGGFTEQRAVRLYESLLGEVLGAGHMRKVATVLIGSKPGSLKLRQAARALVRGFDAALDSMGAPPGAGAAPPEVVLVEVDRLRAEKIQQALMDFAKKVPRIEVAEHLVVTPARGGTVMRTSAAAFALLELVALTRPDATEEGAAALRTVLGGIEDERLRTGVRAGLTSLAAKGISPAGLSVYTLRMKESESRPPPVNISVLRSDKGLRWAALADRAAIPEREVRVDQDLFLQLVNRLTEPSVDDAEDLPGLLSCLAVPSEFQWLLAQDAPVNLEVDRDTAIVPWEFLSAVQQETESSTPLATRIPISRNLRTEHSSVNITEEHTVGPLRALVIGDPGSSARSAALGGAREEARQVGSTLAAHGLKVRLMVGPPGTKERVKGEEAATRLGVLQALLTQRYHIVHYCGHGTFSPSEASGWIFDDGVLTGQELEQLSRPPRLVVANACYSARVEPPSAKQVLKLADEFLRAGVVHYLGAAWRLRDAQSRVFAKAFYEHLFSDNTSVGEAVRAARRSTYDERGGTDDPHIWSAWAAYQHYGDPTDHFPRGTTTA